MKHLVRGSVVAALVAGLGVVGVAPANAACLPGPIPPSYSFTNVARSSQPTDLMSAYITGPGRISYAESRTATVGASMTATVSAEAGIVFAKASASIAVGVTASKAWTAGFAYTLLVPSGQRRRLRLFQESRSFVVTKSDFNRIRCVWVPAYRSGVNAPRTERFDEWKLVA